MGPGAICQLLGAVAANSSHLSPALENRPLPKGKLPHPWGNEPTPWAASVQRLFHKGSYVPKET